MKADSKTESEVMDAVKQCFNAFAMKDLYAMMAFFAPDPDIVVIGTGGDERIFLKIIKRGRSFSFGWPY